MQSIVDFLYMVDDMLWGTPMVVIVLGTTPLMRALLTLK